METTPDASCGFCRTDHGPALERLYFGARSVEKQLDLLLDGGDL